MNERIVIGDWEIDLITGVLVHIPCNGICTAWISKDKGVHVACNSPTWEKRIKIPTMVIDIIRGYLK